MSEGVFKEQVKIDATTLKLMSLIPVYPESVNIYTLSHSHGFSGIKQLPLYAPICEDDSNCVSFLSEESKRDYLDSIELIGFREGKKKCL